MDSYLEKSKQEFDLLNYINKLLMADFSKLFPEKNQILVSLNVYGDNRTEYNNLEGLIFCCLKKSIEIGDFKALTGFVQMYNIVNTAKKNGDDAYIELMDAIANVPIKDVNNIKTRRKIPAKTGFKGDSDGYGL